jgi:predicted metal-dependent HD superfamily phosphohydrolase
VTGDAAEIEARWQQLWARLGATPQRIPTLEPLLQAYRSTDRHYHNIGHILHCLGELDCLRPSCTNADAVELAIWYHDAVYDPKAKDNEKRSAELAAGAMQAAHLKSDLIGHVENLILATRHSAVPAEPDPQVLVDIDLSILGQPHESFAAYEHAIRKEYAHVPDGAFREGRSTILRSFLDRPTIYSTAPMRAKYESAARVNLSRSLSTLAP